MATKKPAKAAKGTTTKAADAATIAKKAVDKAAAKPSKGVLVVVYGLKGKKRVRRVRTVHGIVLATEKAVAAWAEKEGMMKGLQNATVKNRDDLYATRFGK